MAHKTLKLEKEKKRKEWNESIPLVVSLKERVHYVTSRSSDPSPLDPPPRFDSLAGGGAAMPSSLSSSTARGTHGHDSSRSCLLIPIGLDRQSSSSHPPLPTLLHKTLHSLTQIMESVSQSHPFPFWASLSLISLSSSFFLISVKTTPFSLLHLAL